MENLSTEPHPSGTVESLKPRPFDRLVIISFYTPGGYYEEKANDLRAMCDAQGLEHDIAEITLSEGENWADICRRKARHYHEMLLKYKCDIMWLDVDSVIIGDITRLNEGHFDIALFMRAFRYMPQYNVGAMARSFHPGYLLLKYTPRTVQFLDDCINIDRTYSGEFTDDFILEEAFRTSEAKLRIMLLSPDDIERPGDGQTEKALFRHGDSGNVKDYKDKVLQHQPKLLDGESQKRVLNEAISAAGKANRPNEAMTFMRRIIKVMPDDSQTHVKYLGILQRTKKRAQLLKEIMRGRNNSELSPYTIRFEMLNALAKRDWSTADALYQELIATNKENFVNFAHSRMFRFDLDRRAEAMKMNNADRLPLFWWEEPYPGNLGDIINPYVIEKLSGVPPRYAKAGEGVCAIGSIIKFAKEGTPVWGSGSPHTEDTLDSKADYRAVRGPLTRDLVLRNNGECPKIYGDPAWFLPIIYNSRPAKTHRTGLILHFTHEEAPIEIGDEIRRIPIRRIGFREIEAFLDEVLSCERIISTSLHGVIIAQAFGIPAALATANESSTQVHGDGVKFRDYFLSVGLDGPIPDYDICEQPVTDATLPEDIFRKAVSPIPLYPLLNVAPFKPLPEAVERAKNFDLQATSTVPISLKENDREWLVNASDLSKFPGFSVAGNGKYLLLQSEAKVALPRDVLQGSDMLFLTGPSMSYEAVKKRVRITAGGEFFDENVQFEATSSQWAAKISLAFSLLQADPVVRVHISVSELQDMDAGQRKEHPLMLRKMAFAKKRA